MSDGEAHRIHPLLRSAALVVVFALVALLAARQAGSLDVGFHLRAGESILSGEGWPDKDAFTFTLSNRDNIDTNWGYQLLIALARRVAGPAGLVLLHAAAILAVFGLLLVTARLSAAGDVVLPALLLLGALASELRFEVHPGIFSYLFLALTLYLLHRYAERPDDPRAPWLPVALPAIQIVWANMHGLFVLGWAAMACFIVGLWIRNRTPDWRLAGWSLAGVAATLLNPWGVRGMIFPFSAASRMSDDNIFARSIGEFVSPFALHLSDQFPFYPRAPIFAYRLFAILAVVALAGALRRRRWWCALLWLPFFALSVQMVRNIPLLVIAALPWMAWSLRGGDALRGAARLAGRVITPRRLSTVASLLAAALVAVSVLFVMRVATDAYYLDSRRPSRTGLGWNHLSLPVDAADYARKAGMSRERVLNHLDFGGWLMWSLEEPVFIDGRREVVGEEFYDGYLHILENEQAMEEAVRRHGLKWIIFPYISNPRLVIALSDDPRWRIAYADHLAVIFVRLRPEAEPWIDPGLKQFQFVHEIAPAFTDVPGLGETPAPGRLSVWLNGFWRRQVFPSYNHGIGLLHYYRGEIGPAANRFAMAVTESGGAFYETYNNLGSALFHMGEFDLADKAHRVVLARDPGNTIATSRLKELGASPRGSR